jgi:hypothetical protein
MDPPARVEDYRDTISFPRERRFSQRTRLRTAVQSGGVEIIDEMRWPSPCTAAAP